VAGGGHIALSALLLVCCDQAVAHRMVVELSLTLADLPNQKRVMDEPKLNVTAAGWLHCGDGMSALLPKADIG
jgi:hypothetical protein